MVIGVYIVHKVDRTYFSLEKEDFVLTKDEATEFQDTFSTHEIIHLYGIENFELEKITIL